MAQYSNLPRHKPNATISKLDVLSVLSSTVTHIVFDNHMSEPDFTSLDLSRFSQLKELEIGDDCFSYANQFVLISMKKLESVVIGERCFTKCKNSCRFDPRRHFYLIGCHLVKTLRIGHYSFSDYSACTIREVSALAEIQIGNSSFACASLELRSILIHRE